MGTNMHGEEKKIETRPFFLEHNIFIVWKPEYNLGIPIIDEHHRGIVAIINSLYFGMQNNDAKDVLIPTVEIMNDYTRIHFHIEETFLEKIDFPHAQKHRELHNDLSVKLTSAGSNSILDEDPYEFLTFLKNWWINHICIEDLKFRDYLLLSNEK